MCNGLFGYGLGRFGGIGGNLGGIGGTSDYQSQINIYHNLHSFQEPLSLCQHGRPVKLGCPECNGNNILEGECEVVEIDGKKLIK